MRTDEFIINILPLKNNLFRVAFRIFFEENKISPELQPYKAWFLTSAAETLTSLGEEFDQKVLQQIQENRKLCRRRSIYWVFVWGAFILLLS